MELPIKGEPLQTGQELFEEVAFETVQALVLYSGGRDGNGKNPYGFFPYGKPASVSTQSFKDVPPAMFACTLAAMYPFVACDKSYWPKLLKKCSHPMTAMWPWGQVRRHLSFHQKFTNNFVKLFSAYEESKGEYHGPEVLAGLKRPCKGVVRKLDEDSDSEEDEESFERDFDA